MYSGSQLARTLISLKMFKKNYLVKGDISGYRVVAKWWLFTWTIKEFSTLSSAMTYLNSITKP